MSSPQAESLKHPLPLVFPRKHTHKATLINLHGRGSTAQKFAAPLLEHLVSPSTTQLEQEDPPKSFHEHLPNTKFIFPSAPLRRAVVFIRSLTHQWFNNWSLTQPEVKQHLQIQAEIDTIGAQNVVLMGLSQGFAASLVAAMTWDEEPFGALIGMCRWLPFRRDMQDLFGDEEQCDDMNFENDIDVVFERAGTKVGTKLEQVVEWLREELSLSGERGETAGLPPLRSIPVFMGHGMEDQKVPSELGQIAAGFLKAVEVDVDWRHYEGLGHWYSEDMLQDVVDFLRDLKVAQVLTVIGC
ncbi:alpha/beta-hydrolase [Setomelanomma holmii]|uniref:Alpha/beta-hydrolase n=1 Tax=Setomelanomma holmii TaxID=210430 RepID=A0A9P4HI86_9PLEO|nr:alpha/beta-hydrolase [Setomelanomma holmii]